MADMHGQLPAGIATLDEITNKAVADCTEHPSRAAVFVSDIAIGTGVGMTAGAVVGAVVGSGFPGAGTIPGWMAGSAFGGGIGYVGGAVVGAVEAAMGHKAGGGLNQACVDKKIAAQVRAIAPPKF